MVIHSKFKDYYDPIARVYPDKTLVYRRFTDESRFRRIPSIDNLIGDGRDTVISSISIMLDTQVLGFCGKFYPIFSFFQLPPTGGDKITYSTSMIDKIPSTLSLCIKNNFTTMDSLRDVIDQEKSFIKKLEGKEKYRYSYMGRYDVTKKSLLELSSKLLKLNLIDIFFELNTPIFLYGHNKLVVNPRLGELGFASIFNPISAYQEISMFLGGVLGRRDQTPATSGDDKVIRDAKGFDNMSFKKYSPGKKANRAQNKLRKRGI